MKYRLLGKTAVRVSEIGFGGWAIGADWGDVSENDAKNAVRTAIDEGVTFFDTADVYGDGRSERIITSVIGQKRQGITVATKAGRRLDPHTALGYTIKNVERFVDRSLRNLKTERIDLLQLHCPPTPVYYTPELFDGLERLRTKGKIAYYGVSVEKAEEAIKAIEFPGVATVQIIFNIFRQRPKELFFDLAQKQNVGIIVRVPLASGLLTGKMNTNSKFSKTDHRHFNRAGEAFDVGETFAGVPFEVGLKAVEEIRVLVPKDMTMAQFALKWILMHQHVSVVIPGGKQSSQVRENVAASEMKPLSKSTMRQVEQIYTALIRPHVHHRW